MPRYIDADAFWKAMTTRFDSCADLDEISDVLDSMPTISPDDARGVGKWIEVAMRIKCSVCGTDFNDEVTCCSDCYRWPWNYCPNCGARLEVTSDA